MPGLGQSLNEEEIILVMEAIQSCREITGAEEQQSFVITGMGGQGRSEVCLKIANLVRQRYVHVF